MKVHPVHREGGAPAAPGLSVEAMDDVKLEGVGADVSEETLQSILNELIGKLPIGHAKGAAIATAGFRLTPAASAATWGYARAWNAEHQLFESCDAQVDAGCRTITGTDEAEFETQSMMQQSRRDGVDLGTHFGMVSCGGASIQLAVWGPPAAAAEGCVQQLAAAGFAGRSEYNATLGAAFFSWLANHADRSPLDGRYDHEAGGVNEMRSDYDGWLSDNYAPGVTNPCVSPDASAHYATGDVCDFYAGSGTECLFDSWGGYMTHLPGATPPDRAQCSQSVDTFLSSDAMLNAWLSSASCRQLALSTPQWGLLSSFSREAQLGADVSSPVLWSAVLAEITATVTADEFESAEDIAASHVGSPLTSTLLIGFLRHLGLANTSTVRASEADVSLMAMDARGLVPGWVTGCEAALPEGCEPPPNAVISVHAAGGVQRDAAGPFETLTTIEAACAEGFEGSAPEWRLQCLGDGRWRDMNATAGAADMTDAPDCAPIRCQAPNGSGFGTWRGPGSYNTSFALDCLEGYVATTAGPAVVTCNSSNPRLGPTLLASCVPAEPAQAQAEAGFDPALIIGASVAAAAIALVVGLVCVKLRSQHEESDSDEAASLFSGREGSSRQLQSE